MELNQLKRTAWSLFLLRPFPHFKYMQKLTNEYRGRDCISNDDDGDDDDCEERKLFSGKTQHQSIFTVILTDPFPKWNTKT